MSAPTAAVVSLCAERARRYAGTPAKPKPAPAAATLAVRDGSVVLDFGDGTELELSTEHARIWAERLAGMADVAEAMAKEGGGDVPL